MLPLEQEESPVPVADEAVWNMETASTDRLEGDLRREAALADYRDGKLPMREIRRRHGVGAVTLYEWIAQAGLERRPRGPRASQPPLPDGRLIGSGANPSGTWEIKYWHTVRVPGKSLDEALAVLRRTVGADVDVRVISCV